MGATLRVGVDENGLGPRLGPLVVTAASAHVEDDRAPGNGALARAVSEGLLGDSKGLVSYRNNALGEAWARVLVTRNGLVPGTPNAVLEALLHDDRAWLRALCPELHSVQCWGHEDEVFSANEALLARVADAASYLENAGVQLLTPRVVVRCTARLNEALAQGLSRFDVDLHAMEELVAECMKRASRVEAVCGKVGGRDRYLDVFRVLPAGEVVFFSEGRAESVYRFGDRAHVSFIRDADGTDALVGLASLVGKWVRDLLMDRIVRHHRKLVPGLERVSGYHDPKTAKFVDATRLSRGRTGLPGTCFERAKREAPR